MYANQTETVIKMPPLIIGAQRKISYQNLNGVIENSATYQEAKHKLQEFIDENM